MASGLAMTAVPFLTANVSYKAWINFPLNTGELNCEACTVIRGGLAAVVLGGLYPVCLVFPGNGGLAVRYNSALLPEKGNILKCCIGTSKPISRKMVISHFAPDYIYSLS